MKLSFILLAISFVSFPVNALGNERAHEDSAKVSESESGRSKLARHGLRNQAARKLEDVRNTVSLPWILMGLSFISLTHPCHTLSNL